MYTYNACMYTLYTHTLYVYILYRSVSLLIQAPDKTPQTWGGRVVLMSHGWFMLICIASYTANMASFLTTSNLSPALTSWSQVTCC